MFTIDMGLLAQVLVSLAAALVMSFILTPVVKVFAQKVGAVDVPKDGRRMHDHPIPRLGGLAMFLGFLVSTLLFSKVDLQVRGMLLGCVLVVITGVIDDIVPLRWWDQDHRARAGHCHRSQGSQGPRPGYERGDCRRPCREGIISASAGYNSLAS